MSYKKYNSYYIVLNFFFTFNPPLFLGHRFVKALALDFLTLLSQHHQELLKLTLSTIIPKQ